MIRSKIASRFTRAKTMTFLWALLTLALHVWPGVVTPAQAQGSRKDDIVFNSRGIPLAGATIRICAMPPSGQPCTPLAQIYSDTALTQALANPTTSDGMGNYFFYAAPGKSELADLQQPQQQRRHQRLLAEPQRQSHGERQHQRHRKSGQRHAQSLESILATWSRQQRHCQPVHQDDRRAPVLQRCHRL